MELQDLVKQAIDQLGQALTDADSHNGGVIERDRIQYAMRLLQCHIDDAMFHSGFGQTKMVNFIKNNNNGK